MKTYQDLLEQGAIKGTFIISAINEYKSSDTYYWAYQGERYSRQLNTEIMNYQKILYKLSGEAVPNNYSANHKCASNFFSRFITQECQYLLGNGVSFENEDTKEKLGIDFDIKCQKAGKYALEQGVSYSFFNLDHIDIFKATEFVPLYDEETGALKAGIRFWQIDVNKPLRATLYELDGYTEYIRKKGEDIKILSPKKTYKMVYNYSVADGLQILDGMNYPTFPIVPLWANPEHQSELVGIKSEIDAYDLIKSGFANDLDDVSQIYWILQGSEGMDDVDLAQFVDRLNVVKAAVLQGDGATAESHTIDIPYQSREVYLTRLENDLYNDAMALNVNKLSAGNVTATEIVSAYEPLNNKTDQFEYCVLEWIDNIMKLAGVEDTPTFKRSQIVNRQEETQMILSASSYLDKKTVLRHLPFLSVDEIDSILERNMEEEAERYAIKSKEPKQLPKDGIIEGTNE